MSQWVCIQCGQLSLVLLETKSEICFDCHEENRLKQLAKKKEAEERTVAEENKTKG